MTSRILVVLDDGTLEAHGLEIAAFKLIATTLNIHHVQVDAASITSSRSSRHLLTSK